MSNYPPQPPRDPSQPPPIPHTAGPPPGYMAQTRQVEAPGATAGLVLGICSIVFSAPLVGLILAWIGFMKSREARDLCRAYPDQYSSAGIADAGYICSIIGLVIGALSSCCCCGYAAAVAVAIASGA